MKSTLTTFSISPGVGLSTEYALLASMVLAVLAVLAVIITVYTVKWLKRPREEREVFQVESNRAMDTMTFSPYQTETDDESADESDGLLRPKRVTAAKPTSNSRMRFDDNS